MTTDPAPHADRDSSEEPERCATCRRSGWYGSRWRNPKHYAPHIHCTDCETPCRACAVGDGFAKTGPEPAGAARRYAEGGYIPGPGESTPEPPHVAAGAPQAPSGQSGTGRPEIAREEREQRYAEVIDDLTSPSLITDWAQWLDDVAQAVADVADAEQEAQRAEVKRLRRALKGANGTTEMWRRQKQSAEAERDRLAAIVEQVRAEAVRLTETPYQDEIGDRDRDTGRTFRAILASQAPTEGSDRG